MTERHNTERYNQSYIYQVISEARRLAGELEDHGEPPERVAQGVIDHINKLAPGLQVDRGNSPYDIHVPLGPGWGKVVYFDFHTRYDSNGNNGHSAEDMEFISDESW